MTSIPLLLLTVVALSWATMPNGSAEAKYISEFTLDDLTNADASYQPINFGVHPSGRSVAIGGDSNTATSQQHQQQQQQQHPNRLQLIGNDLLNL